MKILTRQLLLFLICTLPAMQAQSSLVGFSTNTNTLLVGETLDISIFANDFDELAGGIVSFSISSLSSISIDDVVVDALWDFDPVSGAQAGNVWQGIGFDVFSNDPLNGDGVIAKISITALDVGVTSFVLLNSSEFFSTSEQLDTAAIIDPSGFAVTVQAVPLPAAIWLMSGAMLGLIGVRKTRMRGI